MPMQASEYRSNCLTLLWCEAQRIEQGIRDDVWIVRSRQEDQTHHLIAQGFLARLSDFVQADAAEVVKCRIVIRLSSCFFDSGENGVGDRFLIGTLFKRSQSLIYDRF